MVGETWDADVTHETSDSQSTRSTFNSEGSIIEIRDRNTVNTEIANMGINDQLKMIREEKHQEYLLNTGSKLLSLENTKNNENTKQLSDPQAGKENLNKTVETKKEFHWPLGTCAIVSDSKINGIDKKNYRKMAMLKFFTF